MADVRLDPTQFAQLQRQIAQDVQRQIERRFTIKKVEGGTFYGGRFGPNGQLLGGLTGGPRYGFYKPGAITEFNQRIGGVIPQPIACRFRPGGFLLHACTPPDLETESPDVRASFDVQIAPAGTADDGDWYSIFDAADGSELYHIQGADRVFSGIDVPVMKTAGAFYATLDIPIPEHISDQFVHVLAGWCIRCIVVKYDEEDAEDAYGNLADLTFMMILDTIE